MPYSAEKCLSEKNCLLFFYSILIIFSILKCNFIYCLYFDHTVSNKHSLKI